jgi:hypothetical protein
MQSVEKDGDTQGFCLHVRDLQQKHLDSQAPPSIWAWTALIPVSWHHSCSLCQWEGVLNTFTFESWCFSQLFLLSIRACMVLTVGSEIWSDFVPPVMIIGPLRAALDRDSLNDTSYGTG